MKFFVAFTLMVAVASADYVKPTPLTGEQAEIQEILAAIHSPSANPTTAAALEQMLFDLLGLTPEPVAVGPAIIEYEPVSVGPAIIDFPVPTEVVPEAPALPAPAIVAPPTPTNPLVQVILNINQAAAGSPAPVTPVVVPEPADIIDPVQIVDNWPVVGPASPVQVVDNVPVSPVQVVDNVPVSPVQVVDNVPVSPVQVVDNVPVSPVQVVDNVPVSPVQVVDTVPVAVEPVLIGTLNIPSAAINLPDELN